MSVFSPWYAFRPWMLARRLAFEVGAIPRSVPAKVHLPFGAKIEVDPYRTIGRCLYTTATYELATAEVAFRLAFGRSLVVDVGANLGYMTLVMASALSLHGQCHAFEPVPELYLQLTRNCGAVLNPELAGRITTHNLALSDIKGYSMLSLPAGPNEGLATLNSVQLPFHATDVECAPLDDWFARSSTVDVLKIDVEGHELSVLKGATKLLESNAIRHIIFEDHAGFDSPVMRLLRRHDFRICLIAAGAMGPHLAMGSEVDAVPAKSAPNWLATRDVADATHRLSQKGWRVLGFSGA